jgi:hypothetical protein
MASGYLSMFLNLGLEYFPGEVGWSQGWWDTEAVQGFKATWNKQ